MIATQAPVRSFAVVRRHAAAPAPAGSAARRATLLRTRAEAEDKIKGVVPGLNQWPPKGFTEHGEPKPEDDPKNYDVVTGERKGGPSEAEIQKKKDEANKDRPFSNPDRQGGTQSCILSSKQVLPAPAKIERGGGGEGMSS